MKHEIGNQRGYILVLTMMIISLIALVVNQLSHKGFIHIYFDQAIVDREKAKSLALGGIQLAFSQLSMIKNPESEKTTEKKSEALPAALMLKKIIPILNRWQIFNLKKAVDGLDGTIQIAINCEQGKLDINEFFDFEKKKFKNEGVSSGDAKKLFQDIFGSMKKFMGQKDLFEVFEKFLKQRHAKLDDVTELLMIPEFQAVFKDHVFYEPPTKERVTRSVYLTDLFTVWSGYDTLQPWFLSDSFVALLSMNRAEFDDAEKRKKAVAGMAKDFKGFATPSAQIWDKQLQPLYGKEYKTISKTLQPLLNGAFEPTIFSVLSYGRVGQITQKIFAIIEKRTAKNNQEEYMIKKLYWL